MDILGYEVGPVACEAAFIADFEISNTIALQHMINKIDSDRQKMDVKQGMRSKYVPLRFDPATGAHQIGGRYLFEQWDDVLEYMRFTTEELEFEPRVKFWDRPFFSNIDKRAWHVVGVHEFAPLVTHYVSRFERFTYNAAKSSKELEAAWPTVRAAAQAEGLASVWLLIQPDEQEIGLLTVATQLAGSDEVECASSSLAALERKDSLSRYFALHMSTKKIFDRTSLNVSIWLPQSKRLGGESSIFPSFPVHPIPELPEKVAAY